MTEELRPIEFMQDEPLVADARGAADIATDLAGLSSMIRAGVEEGRAEKANALFSQAIDEIEGELERDNPIPTPTGVAAVDELNANLTAYQNAMERGDSSKQAAAQLILKQKVQDLKARYPGMADRLEDEYSSFIRTDPEYHELGLQDAAAQHGAEVASLQYKEILRHATQDLFMDIGRYPPGTRQFADVYVARDALFQEKASWQLLQGARTARADQSLREKSDDFKAQFIGRRNVINDLIRNAQQGATRYANYLMSGEAKDLAFANDWVSFGKEAALTEVRNAQLQLQQAFDNEISLDERASEHFQVLQKMMDDTIAYTDRLVAAIEKDDTTALKLWESESLIRSATLREQNPEIDNILSFLETAQPLFKPGVWETFSGEDSITKNYLGVQVDFGIAAYLARLMLNGGQGVDLTGKSPVQIRNMLRQNRVIQTEPYNYPTNNNNDQAQIQSAVSGMTEHSFRFAQLNEHMKPEFVQVALNDMHTAIDMMSDLNSTQWEGADESFIDAYSSDNVKGAIDKARTVPANHNQLRANGDIAFDHWQLGQGDSGHIDRLLEMSMAPFDSNIPAKPFLVADLDDLEKDGTIRYVIDEEAFKQFKLPDKKLTGFVGIGQREATRRAQARRDLQRIAAALSTQATKHLRTQANIWQAQNPTLDVDYGDVFSDNDYKRVVRVPVDTDAE